MINSPCAVRLISYSISLRKIYNIQAMTTHLSVCYSDLLWWEGSFGTDHVGACIP